MAVTRVDSVVKASEGVPAAAYHVFDEITATVSTPVYGCAGCGELVVTIDLDWQSGGTSTITPSIEFNTKPDGSGTWFGATASANHLFWTGGAASDVDVQYGFTLPITGAADTTRAFRVPVVGPAARVTLTVANASDWNVTVCIMGVK